MHTHAPAGIRVDLGGHNCPFRPWHPSDGRSLGLFAFDAETTEIDDERPQAVPSYVLGAACDGRQGYFVTRENLPEFFEAHRGVPFVCHNAAFDLAVCDALLRPGFDIYGAVDRHEVWDTMLLHRLLALATEGHTAKGTSSLEACARTHLGLALPKGETDAMGNPVRASFGQFLGRHPSEVPAPHLAYLGKDALATYLLFQALARRADQRLAASSAAWGFIGPDWLAGVRARFGPLTHHVQLKASVLMAELTRRGVALDQARAGARLESLRERSAGLRERLRRAGYLPGERGCDKALQAILARAARRLGDGAGYPRTATGKYSSAEEDLGLLAAADPFFADLAEFR